MKNTFGNALTLTLFGESHGAAVGAVLDGFALNQTLITVSEGIISHSQFSQFRTTL